MDRKELIETYIKDRGKLLDEIIKLIRAEKPGRIGPFERQIENIDKQIILLQP